MGTFQDGEVVLTESGAAAIVLASHELVSVLFRDGSSGVLPADMFSRQRKFKAGDYVRVVSTDDEFANEVGVVFEDDGDHEENMPYSVSIFDEFESEHNFSASELLPWLPEVGERVIVTDDEDEEGTVVSVDGETARVLWDGYPKPQTWSLSDLEPADGYEDDIDDGGPYHEFQVDDEVDYANPFFADTKKAIVLEVDETSLTVHFPEDRDLDGKYNKDFFSKAA
jgi:hypothetical protein